MFAHGTDHADELPHLRQLAFALAVEQISRAGERRAVGKEERLREQQMEYYEYDRLYVHNHVFFQE